MISARCIGAWLALAFWPCTAHAAQLVGFNWVRGNGALSCVASNDVRKDVTQRLGYNPFGSGPRDIEGIIWREADTWVAEIYTYRSGADVAIRRLESREKDCRSIDAAVGLAIALLINPQAAMSPKDDEVALAPPVTAEIPAACPEAQGSVKVCSHSPPRMSIAIAAGVQGALNQVPGTSLGALVSGQVAVSPWLRLALGMLWTPEHRTTGRADLGVGLSAVELEGCASPWTFERWRPGLCGAFAAGAQHVTVHSPDPLAPGDYWWASARASASVVIDVAGPFGLEAAAGMIFPLIRRELRIEPLNEHEFKQPVIVPEVRLLARVAFD